MYWLGRIYFFFAFVLLFAYPYPIFAKKNIANLPTLMDVSPLEKLVAKKISSLKYLRREQKVKLNKHIAQYIAFINPKNPKELLNELLMSSTQFIICDDLEDWHCLEKKPELMPVPSWRQDADENLGDPVHAGKELIIESFFSLNFNTKTMGPSSGIKIPELQHEETASEALAKRILSDGNQAVAMSLYGIDDMADSLKSVYKAILVQKQRGANIRAVFDVEDVYTELKGKEALEFQYKKNGGTFELIEDLNRGESEAIARLEWPYRDIMHNKFFVLSNKQEKHSIWTGTSNISSTCLGKETNTNMSIYIRDNKAIAQAFLTEFQEMYGESIASNEKDLWNDGAEDIVSVVRENKLPIGGRFHKNKTPNTKRYFVFENGTELRLHFSPTDDGAHRAIIPILLSAEKGDQIRIAMFGNAGIEYVRALQFAAAKGASIRVVIDNKQAGTNTSWYSSEEANLLQKNPYKLGSHLPKNIEVLRSNWPGQNHLKVATITRKGKAEIIIIGSQNWSEVGNNGNDENMISIRHVGGSVSAAEKFNIYFDEAVWALASGKLPFENETRQR